MSGQVTTVHVRIEGNVQGVGYRAWTKSTADDMHLLGWVRNRRDGSVEAVFQGAPDEVDAMLLKCQSGPRHASVNKVETLNNPVGALSGFEILPTA